MSKFVCWYENLLEYYLLEYYLTCAFISLHSYIQILCYHVSVYNIFKETKFPTQGGFIYIYKSWILCSTPYIYIYTYGKLHMYVYRGKTGFFLFLVFAFLKLCFLFPILRGNTRPTLKRWLFIPALCPTFPSAAVPSSPCITAQTTVCLTHLVYFSSVLGLSSHHKTLQQCLWINGG